MTYSNNSPREPRYGRRGAFGGGTLIAVIVVIALIVIGAFYWSRENGTTSNAGTDRGTPAATTGSPPSAPAAVPPSATKK